MVVYNFMYKTNQEQNGSEEMIEKISTNSLFRTNEYVVQICKVDTKFADCYLKKLSLKECLRKEIVTKVSLAFYLVI